MDTTSYHRKSCKHTYTSTPMARNVDGSMITQSMLDMSMRQVHRALTTGEYHNRQQSVTNAPFRNMGTLPDHASPK